MNFLDDSCTIFCNWYFLKLPFTTTDIKLYLELVCFKLSFTLYINEMYKFMKTVLYKL